MVYNSSSINSVKILTDKIINYIYMQAMIMFDHFWGQVGCSRGQRKAGKAFGVLWSGFSCQRKCIINFIYLTLVLSTYYNITKTKKHSLH